MSSIEARRREFQRINKELHALSVSRRTGDEKVILVEEIGWLVPLTDGIELRHNTRYEVRITRDVPPSDPEPDVDRGCDG